MITQVCEPEDCCNYSPVPSSIASSLLVLKPMAKSDRPINQSHHS